MTTITADVQTAAAKMHALLAMGKTQLFERDEALDMLGCTFVACEHAFMLGLPGTAKSMAGDEIVYRIDIDPDLIFSTQLVKGSTPSELVGPMSLRILREEDRFFFNTAGMLPTAKYAIIDEVFKGNSMSRNRVLRVLAEGQFDNGGKRIPANLRTLVTASNEIADAMEDSAFWDRLLVRLYVDPVQDPDNRVAMINAGVKQRKGARVYAKLLLDAELDLLQEARHDVAIPDAVHQAHLKLWYAFQNEGIYLGDRRFIQSMGLAQARALLDGRDALTIDDLDVFRHTAWNHPDERRSVTEVVLQTINPGLADVMKLMDLVEDSFLEMDKQRKGFKDTNNILGALQVATQFMQTAQPRETEIVKHVTALETEGRDATTAKLALTKVRRRLQQATEYQAS